MIDVEAYRFIESAQCEGTYPQLLSRIASQVGHTLGSQMVHELTTIQALPPSERIHEINSIAKYWSRARANKIAEQKIADDSPFEDTSMQLQRASKYSPTELEEGRFEPNVLADRWMRACRQYDRDVILPITEQIVSQLQSEFSSANLLFLGRDFTSVYLYLHASQVIPREQIFLANVSRNVRDACLGDATEEKFRELRNVLERCGLTPSVLGEGDLVIVDSSMKGKIPAVIFRALSLDMTDEEAFRFLSGCHIRYVRSGRRRGQPLHLKALETGEAMKGLLPKETRGELLKEIELIPEFKEIHYPPQVASYIPRRHKIFEWRPKTLQVATGTTWIIPGESACFTSELPKTPSERVTSLLGLMLDIQMQEAGREAWLDRIDPVRVFERTPQISRPLPEVSLESIKSEIEHVSTRGIEAIRQWQRTKPSTQTLLSIVETKNAEVPYELHLGKKPLGIRMRSVAGEGNNVLAYVTDHGTIIKVAKKPGHARKNLLLAWAENLVREYGHDVASVLQVGHEGLYVEQEYIPGENLETRFAEQFERDPESVPQPIVEQVLETFERGRELVAKRGIYLDIKSANYQLRENGQIVNVDYTPRVNNTYYRYFKRDDGRDLKPKEFLDMFFLHDRRKRCLRK